MSLYKIGMEYDFAVDNDFFTSTGKLENG